MTIDRRSRVKLRGLYAITPEEPDTATLLERVRYCIDGGARVVQYRAKALTPELRRIQAERLAVLCRSRSVPFIVNDSVELALEVDADGVHLGRDDGDPRAARQRLGDRLIGVSCYDEVPRAGDAARAGADYVAIGSVFPSATKPIAMRAPLAMIGEAGRLSNLPVVAIGGISADNAPQAIASGADMVAVISAVFDAPDVRAAARSIARLFSDSREEGDDVRTQPRAV